MYDAYDADKLARIWQSLLNRWSQVLKAERGNGFEVVHTRTKKRQQEGGLVNAVEE